MEKPRPRGHVVLQANPLVTVLLLLLSFIFNLGSPGGDRLPAGTGSHAPGPVEVGTGDLRWDPGSLQGRVIIIDPGHGGSNPGTRGVGPLPEKDIVLAVAWDLKGMLEYAGAQVIMTRDGDYSPGGKNANQLQARVKIANSSPGDVYVSIHNDWNNDSRIRGTTSYFYSGEGYYLAEALQKGIVEELDSQSLGVRWGNYYVLRNTKMPAALVELGFLSNKQEANLLGTRSYQTKAARGIYNGLVYYFSNRG
ncbi:MAG: N-acetylmuramoyl-L-alanine amidase [Firmicutes bacterium]|nr:N-acetylmuramoyl-L-alanine amidase [Bacillota bacterium]